MSVSQLQIVLSDCFLRFVYQCIKMRGSSWECGGVRRQRCVSACVCGRSCVWATICPCRAQIYGAMRGAGSAVQMGFSPVRFGIYTGNYKDPCLQKTDLME